MMEMMEIFGILESRWYLPIFADAKSQVCKNEHGKWLTLRQRNFIRKNRECIHIHGISHIIMGNNSVLSAHKSTFKTKTNLILRISDLCTKRIKSLKVNGRINRPSIHCSWFFFNTNSLNSSLRDRRSDNLNRCWVSFSMRSDSSGSIVLKGNIRQGVSTVINSFCKSVFKLAVSRHSNTTL